MKSKRSIIIELAEGAIKTCEVETAKKKRTIQLLEAEAVTAGYTEKIDETFSKLSKTKYDSVTISLPRSLFLIRFLRLPSQDPQEIEKMLPFQLAKVVPYPLDEVIYDFSIAQTESGESKIIIFIIQKKKIEELLKPLEKYKTIPATVTVTTRGLNNWLDFQIRFIKEKILFPVMVIDIDTHDVDLSIIDEKGIIFSRSFDYANDQQLISGIKQSVIIFEKEFGKRTLNKVFFTGIQKEEIIESIDYGKAVFIESRTNFSLKKGLWHEARGNVSFASILGLAQITKPSKFDFSPQYLKERKGGLRRKRQYVETGFIAVEIFFICAIILALTGLDRYFYRNFLDSRLKGMTTEVKEVDKVMRRLKVIDKEFFRAARLSEGLSIAISALPSNTQLIFLEFEENGDCSLKGFAEDIGNVFAIVKALNSSDFFSDAEIKYASQVKRKNKAVVEFYIQGKRRINE